MKSFKIKIFCFALFAAGLTFVACGHKGDHSHESDSTEQTDKTGKEYTSAYICPMHCEGSGSTEAGKCPVCGMDYVKNKDAKADEHDHDNHEGHNH